MDETATVLAERLTAILFAVAFGSFTSLIAWRNGFFDLHKDTSMGNALHWWNVLAAFSLFLLLELIVVPTIFHEWMSWGSDTNSESTEVVMDASSKGWLNIISALCTAAALVLLVISMTKAARHQIFGRLGLGVGLLRKVKSYLLGGTTWLVIYPWILVVGQVIAIMVSWVYQGPEVDQVAVKHLKGIYSNPVLFWVTALAVVTVIPFVEELLFRGFLQTWLKGVLGIAGAIVVTSLTFAFFHYSSSQGIENIELLISLFLLACFLGYVKEKMQSLWASIGLHSTFNFLSILMLLSSGN